MMALDKMYKKLSPQNCVKFDFINVTYIVYSEGYTLLEWDNKKIHNYLIMMPLEEIWWKMMALEEMQFR